MAGSASAESDDITRIYGYRCLVPVDAETARYKYFANLDAEGLPSSVPCEPLYTAKAAEAAQADSPDAIWPDTPDSRYITHMEQALFNFCIVAYTKGYRAGGGTDEVELMNSALAACDASQTAGLAESTDETTGSRPAIWDEPDQQLWDEIKKLKPASENVACLCRDLEGQYRFSWYKEWPETPVVPAGWEYECRAF